MEIKSQILAQMIVKDSDTYVVGASARNFTPIDILIRVVVALLAIAIILLIIAANQISKKKKDNPQK